MAQRLWNNWEISLKRRFILLATSYLDRPHGSRCHWLHWAPLTRVKGIKSQKRKDHSWALLESAIIFFSKSILRKIFLLSSIAQSLSTILQLCIFWNSCFALAHCGTGGTQWPVGNTAEKQHHSQSTGSIFILKLFSLSKYGKYFHSQSTGTIFIPKLVSLLKYEQFFHSQIRFPVKVFSFLNYFV